MPRPASALSSDGLPLWDSFEALFFFVAGLSAGIVLGILLPSLWRTLRRRFRNVEKVAPLDDALLADVAAPFALLQGEEDPAGDESDADAPPAGPHAAPAVAEAFVYARYLVQDGKTREAIRVYLDLLKSDRITKGQTNRALFELGRCYVGLGLEARALDTFLELHHRKPIRPQVLLEALTLARRLRNETHLRTLLASYRGVRSAPVTEGAAQALCHFSEEGLGVSGAGASPSDAARALELARLALRWKPDDAHAQILVWRLTGLEAWQTSREREGAKALWSTMAVDLEARTLIARERGLSPASEADVLSERFAHLAALPEADAEFRAVRREFRETSGASRREGRPDDELAYEALVVYGFLELFRYPRMARDAAVSALPPLLLPAPAVAFLERCRAIVEAAGFTQPFPLAAFFHHVCGRCHAHAEAFRWSCAQCGGHGTLNLVWTPSWAVVQPAPVPTAEAAPIAEKALPTPAADAIRVAGDAGK